MNITKTNFLNIVAFFIAVMWFVYVKVVANIYVSELLLILLFIFMFKKYGYMLYKPMPKKVIVFGVLWLVGQVMTDLIRMTPIEDLAKGWASIIFFLIDFSALYMLLYGNIKRLKLFIVGFAIGGILRCFIDPGYGFNVEPWKFGFAFPTMILSIMAVSWSIDKKIIFPLIGEIFLVILGLLNIYLNARSMGGTMILTALLLFISRKSLLKSIFLEHLNFHKKIATSIGAVILAFTILSVYQWVGESGVLPEKAQLKYDLNKSALEGEYGVFGMVIAGRLEIIASLPAVIDSPIIGHGSWAKNPKYRMNLYDINEILGTDHSGATLTRMIDGSDLIPAHSHIMQSWVWAGFLGVLFWIVVLTIIGKSLILSIRFPHGFTELAIFISIVIIWDLLFSPFSSIMRFRWGWELVLIIMSYGMAQEIVKHSREKLKQRKSFRQ